LADRAKASASFLKKRSKKLLFAVCMARPEPRPAGPKVFWFFFSKKNVLLSSCPRSPLMLARLLAHTRHAFHPFDNRSSQQGEKLCEKSS
jgi:hypothetical protein